MPGSADNKAPTSAVSDADLSPLIVRAFCRGDNFGLCRLLLVSRLDPPFSLPARRGRGERSGHNPKEAGREQSRDHASAGRTPCLDASC